MNHPPILVAGSSRSGSTWVGSTLALAPQLRYIYEPFNVDMGGDGLQLPHQFMYLCQANGGEYRDAIARCLSGQNRQANLWKRLKNKLLLRGHRPLLKDPLAFFSAEWLAQEFGCQIVMTVRHPAAVASSRHQLGWRFDFSHFLEQPLLMQDYLAPFEAEIRDVMEGDRDIIDESVLLWKIIYSVAERYRQQHPDWIVVRHEDLCADPVQAFASLFAQLQLQFTPSVKAQIIEATSQHNIRETNQPQQHSLKRNSRGLVKIWKSRLSESQVERVRVGVGDIASTFYANDEW